MNLNHPARPNDAHVAPLKHDIVILPIGNDAGRGIYDPASSDVFKELRAAGVDVGYLHEGTARVWRVLKGDVPYDFAIGIASSVIGGVVLSAVQAAVAKIIEPAHAVRARLVRERKAADGGIAVQELHYEGPVEGFLEALSHVDDDGAD